MALSPFLRFVEARAQRIEDPVERLRYLRRMSSVSTAQWTVSYPQVLRWCAPVAVLIALSTAPWRELKSKVTGMESTTAAASVPSAVSAASPAKAPAAQQVWMVDKQPQFEVYSNGLRIERTFETTNLPRLFLAFPRDGQGEPSQRREPVGIVFHTTESVLAPFDSKHNESLRRFGKGLVTFAQENQLYHYIVDRFGRVYRVVRESDSANHAGHSTWADSKYMYVRLNQGFMGIAFEGKSAGFGEDHSISEAQVHSGRLLTEMLRDRYQISDENCVTHAQVSVAPVARRIGYHTDWAANFPFAAVGLPDNYRLPVAGQELFGFEYDPEYMSLAGPELAMQLKKSDGIIAEQAKQKGMTPGLYRSSLQKEFQRLVEAMRHINAAKESD
jgi:hypothetical protein